jgi:hypothetical protein
MTEGLVGKYHTPTESIVCSVAFVDSDLMTGLLFLHQQRKIQPSWAATDTGNFEWSLQQYRHSRY